MKLFSKNDKSRQQSFSYYRTSVGENRKVNFKNSDRLRAKNNSSKIKKFLTRTPQFLIVIFSFFCLLYIISLSNDPRIVITQNSENDFHSTDFYRQQIKSILSGSILNYSKLTINTKSVAQQIEQNFPEIQSSSVVLPLLNRRPIVHIKLSNLAAIVRTSSGAYVIDNNGRAILKNIDPNSTNYKQLPKIQDQSQLSVELGKGIIQSKDVAYITTIISELNNNDFRVNEIILPQEANELKIIFADKPYFLKTNLSLDPNQQVGTFLALINRLKSENIQPSQYIDVRVEERAYYL